MKIGIATHGLPHEYFVLRIDGRVNSTHQRLVDALRAGLRLKDQFPQHDIKVGVAQTRYSTQDLKERTVLH